jgi:uncharacterized DUF497 family protein
LPPPEGRMSRIPPLAATELCHHHAGVGLVHPAYESFPDRETSAQRPPHHLSASRHVASRRDCSYIRGATTRMAGEPVARWRWDPDKARTNFVDRKVSFQVVERIFGDPMIATRLDPFSQEERWQSVGKPSVNSHVTLFVLHTDPVTQPDWEEEGRIISARRATSHERRAYEEGQF